VYTQYLWPISSISLMQCFYRPVQDWTCGSTFSASESLVCVWNSLDSATVCASSVNSYKRHLKIFHKDGSWQIFRIGTVRYTEGL